MLLLLAAAVIPAGFLLWKIYQLDRLEREPPGLLLSLVLLGVVSTVLASWSEQLGEALLGMYLPGEGTLHGLLLFFVVVGLSEEGFKYLLMKLRTWRSPDFNCEFDGVVYAVFVSLGFALWENISYVLQFGLSTAIARAVTAVPGHACFGVMMGVWYGMAKRLELDGRKRASAWTRRLALLLPTLLHGLYDYLILTQSSESLGLGFLVFAALLFFVSYRLAVRAARRDRYIISPYWF